MSERTSIWGCGEFYGTYAMAESDCKANVWQWYMERMAEDAYDDCEAERTVTPANLEHHIVEILGIAKLEDWPEADYDNAWWFGDTPPQFRAEHHRRTGSSGVHYEKRSRAKAR